MKCCVECWLVIFNTRLLLLYILSENIKNKIINILTLSNWYEGLGLWCLMPLSTILNWHEVAIWRKCHTQKKPDHKAIHNILSLIGFASNDFSENYWRWDVKSILSKTYQQLYMYRGFVKVDNSYVNIMPHSYTSKSRIIFHIVIVAW